MHWPELALFEEGFEVLEPIALVPEAGGIELRSGIPEAKPKAPDDEEPE